MKRSEVVTSLATLLQEVYGPDSCANIEADALLFFLEEIGMLPPEHEVIVQRNSDFGSLKYIDYKNEWEPENEKK